MLDFSLFGFGGYVAPRHINAIRDTGNRLTSVFDIAPSNSDYFSKNFPQVSLFHEFEGFDAFNTVHRPDYVSICTPNDQHFEQIQWALNKRSHVICEKPIVTEPAQLYILQEMERKSGKKINTILQLRSLEHVQELKKSLNHHHQRHQVDLTYISRRDAQYFQSWKADNKRSGGLITNIGIHLFDLVIWLFGPVKEAMVFEREMHRATGFLQLEHADVRWLLDLTGDLLPNPSVATFRELKIDGTPLRLDQGLQDLHRICYEDIMKGNGLGLDEAQASIVLCHDLNYMKISEKNMLKMLHPIV